MLKLLLRELIQLSGIAREFINDHHAIIVPFQNQESIHFAFKTILQERKLVEERAHNSQIEVENKFNLTIYIDKLEKLYMRNNGV